MQKNFQFYKKDSAINIVKQYLKNEYFFLKLKKIKIKKKRDNERKDIGGEGNEKMKKNKDDQEKNYDSDDGEKI